MSLLRLIKVQEPLKSILPKLEEITIGKLKEIIKDLPDEMQVVVADSEWGDEVATAAEVRTIENDYKKETYLRLS